jgi:hypothetical protein
LQPEYVGTLAQSVEQQTENLCVPGSIPGGTTKATLMSGFFYLLLFINKKSLVKITRLLNEFILINFFFQKYLIKP